MNNFCNDCFKEVNKYKTYCIECRKKRKYINDKISYAKHIGDKFQMRKCIVCDSEFRAFRNSKYCFEHRGL